MLLYALTISLSAFLLFAVQPIIAKSILPWFGGSSAVWSTCMLFFQVVLLLGYVWAHWLHQKLAARKQAMVHIVVLAASLATLPIIPNQAWRTASVGQPSLRILALLVVTVGLPYFLLSSTSPLLQAWYARNHKDGLPYRLFALSNLASMLALLSYPLVVEPNLPTRMQEWVWSGAYVFFVVFCGLTAWRAGADPMAKMTAQAIASETAEPPPAGSTRLLWLGLAASASVLLLAVTNHLTQDVAAIPFLWILPLSVYLLSFILCFESPRFYRRWLFGPLLFAALGFMAYRMWFGHKEMPIRPVIALFGLALFVCCMVCHGELARLKPHPRYLTGFYVTVSLGGAFGGLFVGLVAPNVFHAYYEFPLGMMLCAAVTFLAFGRDLWRMRWLPKYAGMAFLVLALGGYIYFLGHIMSVMVSGYKVVARNFYGQLRVSEEGDPRTEEDAHRTLIHGMINHGEQMLREEYRRLPITYFCPESGIGRAMRAQEGAPRRIGILGLGCGTLAAYGKAGDTIRIYEINPMVLDLAQHWFSYLSETPAKVEVAIGDGRLSLDGESNQQFDILVMDAFSGDSVPVHLVTKEAFGIYWRHLKPGGILAVNVTNTYLDLKPVMERAAAAFGKIALHYDYDADDSEFLCFSCSWDLVMDRATADRHPELYRRAKVLQPRGRFRTWTDDFSNMYSILK
ncbi:Integral membrane protein-like protein [Candidatus Sulfopaludibacter sp. SbA3]|nr:Integral membrane protein-like protein [Candidatus Sulfopaludibacter sp. SbA3]